MNRLQANKLLRGTIVVMIYFVMTDHQLFWKSELQQKILFELFKALESINCLEYPRLSLAEKKHRLHSRVPAKTEQLCETWRTNCEHSVYLLY